MDEQNRRVTDRHSLSIEEMISTEDDSKARALLILLHSLNLSLIANTATITRVSDRLDEHLTLYDKHTTESAALINKGRGAWKVIAWILGIAQVIGVAVWVQYKNELITLHLDLQQDQIAHVKFDSRISNLEKK